MSPKIFDRPGTSDELQDVRRAAGRSLAACNSRARVCAEHTLGPVPRPSGPVVEDARGLRAAISMPQGRLTLPTRLCIIHSAGCRAGSSSYRDTSPKSPLIDQAGYASLARPTDNVIKLDER